MTPQLVLPLSAHGDGKEEAAELIDSVRREGIDLRRVMSVAYVIDFATRREAAFAAAHSMQDTDWYTALYGDTSGWVLRLSRTRRLTADAVTDDLTQVNLLAGRWRGKVRGAAVEDLEPDDVWRRMAAQVQTAYSLRGDQHAAVQVPAQRRAGTAG